MLAERRGTARSCRRRHRVDAGSERPTVLGRHAGKDVGHPVVREICNDESGAAGHRLADAHREIVGLAPRAGEDDITELGRHSGEQLLGELQRQLGEISRVRVECACLPRQRVDDVRMAVTHHRDIVVGVEIGSALLVIHPDVLGAHDLQRLLVKEPVGGGKHPRTACQGC